MKVNATNALIVGNAGSWAEALFDNVEIYQGTMTEWYQENSNSSLDFPSNIEFRALLESLKNQSSIPAVVIDVRTLRELSVDGQIPGSFHIPIADIKEAFQLPEEEFSQKYGFFKPSLTYPNVVLTCKSGGRAKFARNLLSKLGYSKLRVYEGSFVDWVANNGPVCFPNENQC